MQTTGSAKHRTVNMPQLHGHAESVQKVASKDQRVLRSQNRMNPAGRQEHSLTGFHNTSTTRTQHTSMTNKQTKCCQKKIQVQSKCSKFGKVTW